MIRLVDKGRTTSASFKPQNYLDMTQPNSTHDTLESTCTGTGLLHGIFLVVTT